MVVACGAAGLAGDGPLAHGVATSAGGVTAAHYLRFTRAGAPALLKIRISPSALADDRHLELWIDRAYLERMRVHAITPQPEQTAVHDAVVYRFAAGAERHDLRIVFQLEPLQAGRHSFHARIRTRLPADPELRFEQFAWP